MLDRRLKYHYTSIMMLNIDEAARELNVSRATINRMLRLRQITPASERGYYNMVLFEEAEVERVRWQRAMEHKRSLAGLGFDVTMKRRDLEPPGAD